ncbi:histidine phosphatase family protein [Pseudokineococcus marinus]|uniref:Histidine phosphatase family protein n=1 Tax=Pseudokineococcus marinus TaxID=351215 RepID=A0A849C0F3_9ACTN|nr:histidine phosphatase family protein [Pseudokineococcus marinus]NNH23168.1 histidine phosphatase family protein [Pseudokineococcus marinus]
MAPSPSSSGPREPAALPDPSVRTVVHLLRHGEVHNPEGVLYGRLPGYHLSERGRAMAQRVAEHLVDAGHDIALVVASPLERAQETARASADALGLEVGVDERLVEAGNQFQGLTVGVGDGALRRPEHWWKLRNPLTPSWGEPYAEQAARMRAAADEARVRAEGRHALLVSHQLPIWVTRLSVEGRRYVHDPRRRECSLASLTSLHFVGHRLEGVTYREPAADLLPGANPVPGA